jgi:hypothetical protein
MAWWAIGLFALIKVLGPWWLGEIDPMDQDLWWPLLGQLAITLALAIALWRMFENDGIVLIVTLMWLLSTPMYRAVAAFMVAANE